MALENLSPMVRALLAEGEQRQRRAPTFTPEEQESIMSQALSTIGSGLGWIGESLDKALGGRTVRAMADDGIDLSDFAHLIPFSDTLGLTDEGLLGNNLLANKNEVPSGADFRDRWGWTTGNPWLDIPTSIGIEIAMDPATVISGPGKSVVGGVNAAAKAGKLLGTSPARVAQEIAEGTRGLASIRLPFVDAPLAVLGKGPTAAKAYEAVAYSAPVRAMRDIFDVRAKGIFDKSGQKAADAMHSGWLEAQKEILDTNIQLQKRMGSIDEEYNAFLKQYLENNPDLAKKALGGVEVGDLSSDEFARSIAEFVRGQDGLGRMRALAEESAQLAGTKVPDNILTAFDRLDDYVDQAIKFKDDTFDQFRKYGGDVDALTDEFITGHFPRRPLAELKRLMGNDARAQKVADGVWGAVRRTIRDVPGGTLAVNRISKDPNITGILHDVNFKALAPAERNAIFEINAQRLATEYGLPTQVARIDPKTGAQVLDDAGQPVFDNPALDLATHMAALPQETVKTGLFARSTATDLLDYTLNMARRTQSLKAAQELLIESASDTNLGPTLGEIFGATKTRRIKSPDGWRTVTEKGPLNMTKEGLDNFSAMYAAKKGAPPDIDNLRVPEIFQDSLERLTTYHAEPWKVHGIVKAYDSALAQWKGLIFNMPASYNRNFISGMWQNFVTAFKNPVSGMAAVREAMRAVRGKIDNPEYLRSFKTYGLLSGINVDDIYRASRAADDAVPSLKDVAKGYGSPLTNPSGAFSRGKGSITKYLPVGPGSLNFLSPDFFMVAGGQKFNEVIEFTNRYSHFVALKKRGWSDAAAARSVKLAHFDYGSDALTTAEREIFKRLVPFYRFTRANLPAQLRAIIDEPGGRTAQTIRAISQTREETESKNKYVPAFLGEGLAIPVGKDSPEGMRNYFVSKGLTPVEEAFNRFPTFGNLPDWKHIGENALSMATPAISGPAQALSERQFWSHRNLKDLYSDPTQNDIANFWLYQSPASRYIATGRTLMDERKTNLEKAVNLLIGSARVTTVDVPKWMQIEARNVLERKLKPHGGIGEFSKLYARDLEKLDDETVLQLSILNEILRETREMNKARKAANAK